MCAGSKRAYFGSPESEGIVAVACDALAIFALNPASHRSLHAAATFQSTLNLLSSLHVVDKAKLDTTETKELVSCIWIEMLRWNAEVLQPCYERVVVCSAAILP